MFLVTLSPGISGLRDGGVKQCALREQSIAVCILRIAHTSSLRGSNVERKLKVRDVGHYNKGYGCRVSRARRIFARPADGFAATRDA